MGMKSISSFYPQNNLVARLAHFSLALMLKLFRQCLATALMEAGSQKNDAHFIGTYVIRLLRVLILLSLWRMILAQKGNEAGLSLTALLTYTVIAEVFGEVLNCRIRLFWAIWEGTLAYRFVRPMGIVSQFTSEMVGEWLWGFLFFSLPLLALSPLLGVHPLPASLSLALWFATSLLLAVVNGLAIEFLFALLMLSLESSIYNINRVRKVALTLLSGALIPLAFYPYGIGDVLAWSPFAQTASAPLLIYIGQGDPIFLIGLQMSWAIVLWIAFALYWQRQRERLTSQGG